MLFTKVLTALAVVQAVLAAPHYTEDKSLTNTHYNHHKKAWKSYKYTRKSYKGKKHKSNTTTTTRTAKVTRTTTATAKATSASSAGSGDIKSQALAAHNKYRSKHHVPNVKWSTKLSNHAQTVTDSCVWGHSMKGTGQNIAYGYKSMEAVVDAWYNEVKNYNYKNGGFSSSTGHFTQVVWKSTTEIGCAATYCSNLKATYYVCDYSPPGNCAGQYQANVLAP
ncbi:CAP domain-containing protein [Gilbertella persicaria]|uniref:CAP domain-containing protein n=1 Tax=Gilbertella persicaria TaxID=101096 RepID=UPI00221F9E6E|nr:CAP domain-containing protein [Gilbertella persicaria]KAI8077226.1 CAP domain-containing protein [Gilbertella persicaria]